MLKLKKLVAILLSISLLFSIVGLQAQKHWCCDELIEITFFDAFTFNLESNCCDEDLEENEGFCCETESFKILNLDVDFFQTAHQIAIPKFNLFTHSVVINLNHQWIKKTAFLESQRFESPPHFRYQNQSINTLFQIFLI